MFFVPYKRHSDDDELWEEYPIPRHLLEPNTDESEDDDCHDTPDFTSYEW